MDRQILITGSNGQLGRALVSKYPEAQSLDSNSLDITNSQQVLTYPWENVSVIVNAAAYTNVDTAETSEGRTLAWQVNAVGTANLTRTAITHDIPLIHISTDYVFDGTNNIYKEDAPLCPLGVYGQSKAAGDIAALIHTKSYLIRTSWVIGDGNNFVRTMLSLANKGINPTVVADQFGRPTFAEEIANAIDFLLTNKAPFGIYNVSNDGPKVNWADFARTIFAQSGNDINVTNTTTIEYFASKENIAPRPLNSTFDLNKIKSLGYQPKDWRESLKDSMLALQ